MSDLMEQKQAKPHQTRFVHAPQPRSKRKHQRSLLPISLSPKPRVDPTDLTPNHHLQATDSGVKQRLCRQEKRKEKREQSLRAPPNPKMSRPTLPPDRTKLKQRQPQKPTHEEEIPPPSFKLQIRKIKAREKGKVELGSIISLYILERRKRDGQDFFSLCLVVF